MEQPYSDAVVFFGATGDLAYKQISPSLQKLAKRGKLTGPVIGVAKAGWNLEQFKHFAQYEQVQLVLLVFGKACPIHAG